MPEIRLDVRLLRPGALVAGVAAGRCVLVRAVPEPGGGVAWTAAFDAGLPVSAVREARCGERDVLVVAATGGQPLSPAVGHHARTQAAALGQALAGHGIAVSQLRRDDLAVCDGVLAVRAPVAGPAEAGEGAAAFVAMVAAACAPEPEPESQRRQRMVPAAIVAMAVLAVVVTLVPSSGPTGRAAPRAAAAVPAAPRAVVPDPVPAAAPRPPTARVREPVAAKPARKPKAKRRAVAPATSGSAVRVHPARPSQPPAGEPPGDDIPVAGGDADPVPAR